MRKIIGGVFNSGPRVKVNVKRNTSDFYNDFTVKLDIQWKIKKKIFIHQVLVEAQNVDAEYWKKFNLPQNYE